MHNIPEQSIPWREATPNTLAFAHRCCQLLYNAHRGYTGLLLPVYAKEPHPKIKQNIDGWAKYVVERLHEGHRFWQLVENEFIAISSGVVKIRENWGYPCWHSAVMSTIERWVRGLSRRGNNSEEHKLEWLLAEANQDYTAKRMVKDLLEHPAILGEQFPEETPVLLERELCLAVDRRRITGGLIRYAEDRGDGSEGELDWQGDVSTNKPAGKIIVDGIEYDAKPHECNLIQAFIDADGEYLTGPTINKTVKGCGGKKVSDLIKEIEEKIPAITNYLRHEGNKGYRLLLKK